MKLTLKIIVVIFILLTLAKAWKNTRTYGGGDLRIRIVGARLLGTGNSPYFYKWDPKDGDYLAFPSSNPSRRVNGNVVTPAVLYMLYPLATLPYSDIRIVWTILQLILLLLSIILLGRAYPWKPDFNTALFITIILLVCTNICLYNIERGQIYILYLFAFCAIYFLGKQKGRYSVYCSGLIAGIMVFIRPFFLVTGIGHIVQKNKPWILGFASGGILGTIFFVLPDSNLWNDYFAAMREYTAEVLGNPHPLTEYPAHAYPPTIEGMSNTQLAKPFSASGLHFNSVWRAMGWSGYALIVYGFLVAAFTLAFWKRLKTGIGSNQVFLFGFFLYILAEILVVTPRAGYNLIQWIFPVYLMISLKKENWSFIIILILGLLLLLDFPFQVHLGHALGELFLISLLGYCIYKPELAKIS